MMRGIESGMMVGRAAQAARGAKIAGARAAALVSIVCLLPPSASAQSSSDSPEKFWPTAVDAHYKLQFNGFNVGFLNANTRIKGSGYTLTGSGKFQALWGAITWTGSSSASGSFTKGAPQPSAFNFTWANHRKNGFTKVGFKDRTAREIEVVPPPDPHKDTVPVEPAHKVGLDPISALLTLTRADGKPPCERTANIFDGKQRYDIVLTPKRTLQMPLAGKGSPPETAHVCRVMYVPIAGHRDNEATKTYRSNKEVEVVMRRVPGHDMYTPHSVTVPTFWGTGVMVAEHVEITMASGTKIALAKH
jgi:Protein of unknown function (DUF3108)